MTRARAERFRLSLELFIAAGVLPLAVAVGLLPRWSAMPLLLVAAALAMIVFHRHRPRLATGSQAGFRQAIAVGLGVWLGCVFLTGSLHLALDKPLLPMLWQRPRLLVLIALFYPISAAAQELLFRAFFFWRYSSLLPRVPLAALNVLVFAWVHIVYGQWISIALSALAGMLFTSLYLRYGSLWAVIVVHSAFGLAVFAMGYGPYFYHGAK